jgi:hypothetical protein
MNKNIFIFLFITLLSLGFASANTDSCITFSGCVDGMDYVSVTDGLLFISHASYDPMGMHGGCPSEYRNVVYIDDVAHSLSYTNGKYLIDGEDFFDVNIYGINSINVISGRSSVTLDGNIVTIDDNGPGGSSVYTITMCGQPSPSDVPEFGLIAGFLVVIAGIGIVAYRRK